MHGPLSLKNKMLSTPLIQISKTSTPIRSRVISSNLPLNSTPISQLKIAACHGYTLSDKQNSNIMNFTEQVVNQQAKSKIQPQQKDILNDFRKSNAFSKTISFGNYKLGNYQKQQASNQQSFNRQSGTGMIEQVSKSNPNFSPILALNKKLAEGPLITKNNSFRSLTPNCYSKTKEALLKDSREKSRQEGGMRNCSRIFLEVEEKGQRQSQLLQQSNVKRQGLKSSSSFSTLIDKHTPSRLGSMTFNSLSRKKSLSPSSGVIKQSLSFNLPTSNTNFHSQKSPNSNQGSIDNSHIDQKLFCVNNHSKMAKYRVKSSCHDGQDDCLVYCSKCAIDLVQKGFTVEELVKQDSQQGIVIHTSPREGKFAQLRQSKTFQNKFLNFKPSYNSETLQKLKTVQRIKCRLNKQIITLQARKQQLERKHMNQMQEIDCYYNSVIAYIEQQRQKDKDNLLRLKEKIWYEVTQLSSTSSNVEELCLNSLGKIQSILKTKNINFNVMKQLEDIQFMINQNIQRIMQPQMQKLMHSETSRMIDFTLSIQEQFDNFVSFLDSDGRLKYKTFEELACQSRTHESKSIAIGKNHALRFSFQKALQQNKKKSFQSLQQLEQYPQEQQYLEDEQYVDQNSFSQYNQQSTSNNIFVNQHQQQTLNNDSSVEQKPFRTLFTQQDGILQQEDEDGEDMLGLQAKNNMYSPTFKAI